MIPESPMDHEGHRDRLRKRFMAAADEMDESELLELILTYSIPRKDVALLAKKLIEQFKSIDSILSAPIEELTSFPGIGESTTTLFRIINATSKMKKSPIIQPALFIADEGDEPHSKPIERPLRAFVNDEIANSLLHLPKVTSFSKIEEYKAYLLNNLPYNSEETRKRRANYILDRFFPNGSLKSPLFLFLKNIQSEDLFKPIVFYQVLKSEPISVRVAEELIYPSLPVGRVNREQIKDFVLRYLPETSDSSLKNMLRSILYSYQLLDIGNLSGDVLRFQLRQGTFEPFLYIFSSEFCEPGTYSFDQLFQSPLHRWLLWDREWLHRQIYNLRDMGVISKISEIDNLKQFTVELDQTAALEEFFCHREGKMSYLRDRA